MKGFLKNTVKSNNQEPHFPDCWRCGEKLEENDYYLYNHYDDHYYHYRCCQDDKPDSTIKRWKSVV